MKYVDKCLSSIPQTQSLLIVHLLVLVVVCNGKTFALLIFNSIYTEDILTV